MDPCLIHIDAKITASWLFEEDKVCRIKNWGIINASSYLWNNSYTGGLKVAIE